MKNQYDNTVTTIGILTEGSSTTNLLEAHNSNLIKLNATGLILILCKKHWKSELSKSNSPLDFADKFRSAIVRDWTELMGIYFPGFGVEYTCGCNSNTETDFLEFSLPKGDDWLNCSISYEYLSFSHPTLHFKDWGQMVETWKEYQKFSDPFYVDRHS